MSTTRLLIIEDDPDTARLFAEVFTDGGFLVHTCTHDTLPERGGYAAVLTDLGVRYRSRERAREWVGFLQQRYGSPVIIVSGLYLSDDAMHLAASAAEVIQKPVDIDELVGRVTGVLARQPITA